MESIPLERSLLCQELPTESAIERKINVRNHRILLVDDNEDLLLGLKVRLMAHGFELVVAQDGAGAMKMVAEHLPDVVILDLRLPAGDGLQVLQWLKSSSEFANIPVIVCSARDSRTHEAKALAAGAAAFLQKPADTQQLLDAISVALEPRSLGLTTPDRHRSAHESQ
jgi:two-component system KDP operon response regulator KdpE